MTGLEAVGLGLIRGGLKAYAGYPMTPASGLLHFLAKQAPRFALKVVQPEGEIAAMMMALGHAYAGERAAVGTSGGGFCLMTEGLSQAGQAELPIVVVLGQRTGPSTGLPTYTAQADLEFALSAGHGEFPRVVLAPADVEQAYAWSTLALDLAWAYQLPVIVLTDRTLNDDSQSFVAGEVAGAAAAGGRGVAPGEAPKDAKPRALGPYLRYLLTESGVSPLAYPGRAGATVKVNTLHARRGRAHHGGPGHDRGHAGQVGAQGLGRRGRAGAAAAGQRVRRRARGAHGRDVGLADRRGARSRRAGRAPCRPAGGAAPVPGRGSSPTPCGAASGWPCSR